MTENHPSNEQIAKILEQIADFLEVKDANPFRVSSYRDAAETIRESDKSIGKMALKKDEDALKSLPDIGEGIASIIQSYSRTGRSELLERLQGEISPGELFTQVPGIGSVLAKRISEELEIASLEELEQAAHDGRLRKVEGFGKTKVENIRVSLAGMLSAAAQRARIQKKDAEIQEEQPQVSLLLEIDRTYREKAEAGQLRKIAPKRFNPEEEAWLPIYNTHKEGWDFTTLYSNTARAHDLNKTHDWVVIYYEKNGIENQATVVTETKGPLEGLRVIRGREAECHDFYMS
jgi:hypothetical protein